MNPEYLEETARLDRFFSPKSVALVGATDDVAKFGGQVFQQVLKFGYRGKVYPINPNRQQIGGLQCYPSVLALPETPDHVGIAVPPGAVLDTLKDCHARGVRYVTALTSGFAETGTEQGIARQKEIVDFCRANGMRMMGPNCNGFVNFVDRFSIGSSTTGSLSAPRTLKNIAIVAQSGGLGQVNVMWRTVNAGLGVNYQVSCGNEADLDMMDFATFFLQQESTDVLLMAIEGIRRPEKFIELAEFALSMGKPIVALKFGRSELGQKMAASHTGSLAGADAIFDAVCRQFGIIRVEDCNQLYEMAIALHNRRKPITGSRIGSVAPSGGNVVQIADLGSTIGLTWPSFPEPIVKKLQGVYPARTEFSNPVDTQNIGGTLMPAIEVLETDPGLDVVIVVFTMINRASIDRAVALAKKSQKTIVVLWTGRCTDEEFTISDLVQLGVPAYSETLPCLKAIHAAARYYEFRKAYQARSLLAHPSPGIVDQARKQVSASAHSALTEREAKNVLRLYGIPVTLEKLAASPEEAVSFAKEIGTPVALKIESPDIMHKTEAGGIRLGLSEANQIRDAYSAIIAAAKTYAPKARLNGVLVQKMADPGVEIIVGIATDSVFGPVVVVGLGGIHVEVLRDVTYRIPPINRQEAQAMIRELRAYKILEGVRGKAPSDIAALLDTIVRASWLAHDMRDIVEEVDINPLLLSEKGACAADALILRKGS